jgi:predicted MPP superfamily phosphohydrolase
MAVLLGGSHYFVIYRFWNMIPFPVLRWVVSAGIVAALAMFIASFVFRGSLPLPVTAVFYRIGASWVMIFLYLLMLFIALDLLRLVPFIPVRRILQSNMTTFGIIAAFFVLVFTYGYINYRQKHRTYLPLQIAKTTGLPSLKIFAMSDLHLGAGIGKTEFESWLPLIEAEQPDIVLIAGDVVDSDVRPLEELNFAESLRRIKSKYGVYAVIGNHEYIGNLHKSERFLRTSGMTVLRDSAVLVADAFYIIGRDDRTNPDRKPITAILEGLDPGKPLILLDHQPADLAEAAQSNIDLQISGHTHDGQIWPLSHITGSIFEKSHGYIKKSGTHIYVTSGLGIWGGKFRIGTVSEYAVIDLSFKGK